MGPTVYRRGLGRRFDADIERALSCTSRDDVAVTWTSPAMWFGVGIDSGNLRR